MKADYNFIISMFFHTGKHQTRALAESLLSPSDCVREIVHELSSGMAAELGSYFSSLGPGKTSGLIHGSHLYSFLIQCLMHLFTTYQMEMWRLCWRKPVLRTPPSILVQNHQETVLNPSVPVRLTLEYSSINVLQ